MEPFAKQLMAILRKTYPKIACPLVYKTTEELLFATMLSAQCTDEQVNKVTKQLFKKYRSLDAYAHADVKELKKDIYSTGFHNNKAKNIIATAKKIKNEFKGKVPKTMEGLLTLPGVARKTANVVLTNAFGKIEGIIVDTHVIRITNRLGLTKEKTAEKIEKDLMQNLPKKEWYSFAERIRLLGREYCKAQKPLCKGCPCKENCPSANTMQ